VRARRLQLEAPALAARPCEVCERFMHDDDPKRGWASRPTRGRDGKPVPRVKGTVPPCYRCPKFDPDTPPERRNPRAGRKAELSERGRRVLAHYQECRAVGRFPDDPLVQYHAGLVRQVEDAHDRGLTRQQVELLTAVLTAFGAGR
jgi:hypothetical protein